MLLSRLEIGDTVVEVLKYTYKKEELSMQNIYVVYGKFCLVFALSTAQPDVEQKAALFSKILDYISVEIRKA